MTSHIGCRTTLASPAGITPPPREWVDDDGKPIHFDRIDNSAHPGDPATRNMSQHLPACEYGAASLDARLLRGETIGARTFEVVGIASPGGDAASFMSGVNPSGRITGIASGRMAGD